MKSRIFCTIVAVTLSLGMLATPAQAQKYPVHGTIVSIFASIEGDSITPALYTMPDKGNFILKEFCASDSNVFLNATTIGTIVVTTPTSFCYSFDTGIALPANVALKCDNNPSYTNTCTISGILEH